MHMYLTKSLHGARPGPWAIPLLPPSHPAAPGRGPGPSDVRIVSSTYVYLHALLPL